MSRFNLELSYKMYEELHAAITPPDTLSSVVRKALAMYIAADKAKKEEGLSLGFFNPETKEVVREIIGI
jgi:hypothetical protein